LSRVQKNSLFIFVAFCFLVVTLMKIKAVFHDISSTYSLMSLWISFEFKICNTIIFESNSSRSHCFPFLYLVSLIFIQIIILHFLIPDTRSVEFWILNNQLNFIFVSTRMFLLIAFSIRFLSLICLKLALFKLNFFPLVIRVSGVLSSIKNVIFRYIMVTWLPTTCIEVLL
jgi:hypothetical protein